MSISQRLLLVVVGLLLFVPFSFGQSSTWLDSAWTYRSAVTVSNPGGTTLTAYQVHVVLTSSFDFTKAQSNGSDIRFTNSDGVTLLPFWIEGWNPASSSASLWVNVPSIPSAGTTLYMYYGNSMAVSASNGNATFDFFDDFSSGSIDSSKWTASGGTWSIVSDTRPDGSVGGVLRANAPIRQILSTSFSGTDYIAQVYGKQISGRIWGVVTRASSISNMYTANLYDDLNATKNLYLYSWVNDPTAVATSTVGNVAVGTVNPNTWYQLMVKVYSTNEDVYKDGALKVHGVNASLPSGRTGVYGEPNTVAEFSTMLVRKYASTEPTSIVGSFSGITTPEAFVSANSLTFGTQTLGTTSAAQTISLNSAGPLPLSISQISVSGDFSQTNNCPFSPATLPSGSSCTVSVFFTPNSAGARSGSLLFTDNAPNSGQSVG